MLEAYTFTVNKSKILCVSITQNITQYYIEYNIVLLMKTDRHFYHFIVVATRFTKINRSLWTVFLSQWWYLFVHLSRARSLIPLLSNRFFLAGRKGNDEERVRMNVTPAERRGFRAKTTSRTPLAWLLFLFVLFSSFLSYIPLLSFFFSPLHLHPVRRGILDARQFSM